MDDSTKDKKGRNENLNAELNQIDEADYKVIEQAIIRAERIAAVSTFAGGIAHEFNNIHTSIIGFLSIVLDNETLNTSVKEKLEYALASSYRAAEVTKRLLAFTVNKKAERTSIQIKDIVEDALNLVKNKYESEGINFQVNHKTRASLFVDKEQLTQVVLNMLINSHHATAGKGKKNIAITTGIENNTAYIKIKDNGCGIPKNEISKVFTPFFTKKGEHADFDAPMAKAKGVGLGLSICQTIVDNHGGEIKVSSTYGEETEFTLLFPIDEHRSTKYISGIYKKLDKIIGTKVLILDDEELILNLVSHILGREGCLVTAIDSGAEALELLKKVDFDIALIDLQMPKMNGIKFMQELDKLKLKNSPIKIVLTGEVTDENSEEIDELDVFTTIRKPFKVATIYRTIAKAITKKNSDNKK